MQAESRSNKSYKGIYYMLIAAMGFSIMSGFAKMLKVSFDTPQLVFYRNLTGFLILVAGFLRYPVQQTGGRIWLLIFRGLMGTIALYTLMYNIIHIDLGTAMTYNVTNTLFIAILSGWLLKEKIHVIALLCVVLGFAGVLLIYKPSIEFGYKFHIIGLICGLSSALAYLSISSLKKYYDTRIIVLSFIMSGMLLPAIGMLLGTYTNLPNDGFFISFFRLPAGIEWFYVLGMGATALLGQYFVTRAYSYDKAGIVSAIGYTNIIFALFIGVVLGDAFPDYVTLIGILLVMISGIVISVTKK